MDGFGEPFTEEGGRNTPEARSRSLYQHESHMDTDTNAERRVSRTVDHRSKIPLHSSPPFVHAEITSLKAQIIQTQNKNQDLAQQNQALTTRAQRLTEERQRLHLQVRQLTLHNEQNTVIIDELNTRVRSLRKTTADTVTKNDDWEDFSKQQDKTIKELEGDLKHEELKLKNTRKRLYKANTTITELKKETEALKVSLRMTKIRKQRLSNRLAQHQHSDTDTVISSEDSDEEFDNLVGENPTHKNKPTQKRDPNEAQNTSVEPNTPQQHVSTPDMNVDPKPEKKQSPKQRTASPPPISNLAETEEPLPVPSDISPVPEKFLGPTSDYMQSTNDSETEDTRSTGNPPKTPPRLPHRATPPAVQQVVTPAYPDQVGEFNEDGVPIPSTPILFVEAFKQGLKPQYVVRTYKEQTKFFQEVTHILVKEMCEDRGMNALSAQNYADMVTRNYVIPEHLRDNPDALLSGITISQNQADYLASNPNHSMSRDAILLAQGFTQFEINEADNLTRFSQNHMQSLDAEYGIGTMAYHNEIHPQEVKDFNKGHFTTFLVGQPLHPSARVELLVRERNKNVDEFGAPAEYVPSAKKPSKKGK